VTARTAVTAAALAVSLLAPSAAPAASSRPKTDRTLRADLVRLAKSAGGSGGFTVLDGSTGRVIAESAGTTARPLGSTAKLLTTDAALRTLGAAHALTTTVALNPNYAPGGVLDGDVYLIGGGDPLLGEAQLQTLATDVTLRGVKTITGSIIGDETLFDTLRGGPATHGAFDLNFGGTLGALTYDRGRQAVGGPLQPDPGRAAAFRLDDVLEARGVTIAGTPRAGATPAGLVPLGAVGSVQSTVGDVVKVIDKQSDDFAAEVLTKDLGAARHQDAPGYGTTANGVRTIKSMIYGLPLRPVDGSGVDPATEGSSRALARFVQKARKLPELASALPIAGVDGTLANRMTTAPARGACHAKTGSLPQSHVSALAGWCRVGGRTLVFALQRTHVRSQPAAKAAEDAMVQRIASSRRR
jgi:D-alanyl-D-alanine carboxypeptidase/D-alanyl-D-alanine-endopeptidase (penicillin-binding protein 4)